MILHGIFEEIDTTLPFDWKKHKDNFPHYLEVIITPKGDIQYAVPDHKSALELYAKVTDKDCPKEYWFSMIEWLTALTGCICVYTDYYSGKANDKQISALQFLKDVGIYEGSVWC